ncbi:unnamed protein product [Arctia plantaginis]|uniref:Uncharacterized protein n=1 Tax=Arctia plantaginis TaxID=874455 RepID=A0A8S1B8N6_ARCPL|nr:unnamed protein product [Arctia plantaginis]
MREIVISIFFLVAGCTGTANFDDFMGKLTPVATVPPVDSILPCTKMIYSKNPENSQCKCLDEKKTELIDIKKIKQRGNNVATIPVVVAEDASDALSLLNVTCDCGGEHFGNRAVVKLLNENYFVIYTRLSPTENEPVLATVFAKAVPAFLEIVNLVKTIPGLGNKTVGIVCSVEFDPSEASQ